MASASTHDPVRLSGVSYLADLPTLVALEEGIFERHDLNITVDRQLSGKHNLEALRAGETDFALMAPSPLVLDLLAAPHTGEATDPLIIASLVYSSRLNHVVALADRGIRDPSDLAGGRVGLMAGTNTEFLWWLYTALYRLDPDDVTVIDLPVSELPEALIRGDIDAAVLWEPWTTRLKTRLPEAGAVIFLPGVDIFIENWILVTRRGMLEQRRETVDRLLSAYQEAVEVIDDDPTRALALYAEDVGLEAEQALHDPDPPLLGLSLDWSLLTSLQQMVEWAEATGKPIATPQPGILSWIDARPLQKLRPAAVSIPVRDANLEAIAP